MSSVVSRVLLEPTDCTNEPNRPQNKTAKKDVLTALSRVWLAAIAVLAATLSGCSFSSFKPEQVEAPGFVKNRDAELYASITETDTGWRLRKIERRGDVKLGDFEYQGETLPKENVCSRGYLGITEGDCDEQGLLFYETKIDPGVVISPIGWPIVVIACLSPKFWDMCLLPIWTSVAFGWDDYMEAIEEAKAADNYDAQFATIYNRYALMQSDLAKQEKSTTDLRDESRRLHDQLITELATGSLPQLQLDLTDYSRLANARLLEDEITHHLKAVADVQPVPEFKPQLQANYQSRADLEKMLFPADDLSQFDRKLSAAEQNFESAESTQRRYEQTMVQYRQALARKNGSVSFSDKGSLLSFLSDYDHQIRLPESVSIRGGVLGDAGVIRLIVTSRDFKNALPTHYANSNTDLIVALNGRNLSITNMTKKYITLDAVSLYHNGDVLTRGGADFQNYVELAPGTTSSTITLDDFSLEKLSDDYRDMTRAKAEGMSVEFGFAVKYRITESDSLRTLFKQNTYSLLSVLEDYR